jgi:hypothetical protein
VVDAVGSVGLAEPHNELAVASELMDVPAGLCVIADPDKIVMVN